MCLRKCRAAACYSNFFCGHRILCNHKLKSLQYVSMTCALITVLQNKATRKCRRLVFRRFGPTGSTNTLSSRCENHPPRAVRPGRSARHSKRLQACKLELRLERSVGSIQPNSADSMLSAWKHRPRTRKAKFSRRLQHSTWSFESFNFFLLTGFRIVDCLQG